MFAGRELMQVFATPSQAHQQRGVQASQDPWKQILTAEAKQSTQRPRIHGDGLIWLVMQQVPLRLLKTMTCLKGSNHVVQRAFFKILTVALVTRVLFCKDVPLLHKLQGMLIDNVSPEVPISQKPSFLVAIFQSLWSFYYIQWSIFWCIESTYWVHLSIFLPSTCYQRHRNGNGPQPGTAGSRERVTR